MTPTNSNATGGGGVNFGFGGQAKLPKTRKKIFRCSAASIARLSAELQREGLALGSTNTDTQRTTLLRVLQYLGPRGVNTYQAVGCGYARVATRVFELVEAGWDIVTQREDIYGPERGRQLKNLKLDPVRERNRIMR